MSSRACEICDVQYVYKVHSKNGNLSSFHPYTALQRYVAYDRHDKILLTRNPIYTDARREVAEGERRQSEILLIKYSFKYDIKILYVIRECFVLMVLLCVYSTCRNVEGSQGTHFFLGAMTVLNALEEAMHIIGFLVTVGPIFQFYRCSLVLSVKQVCLE